MNMLIATVIGAIIDLSLIDVTASQWFYFMFGALAFLAAENIVNKVIR